MSKEKSWGKILKEYHLRKKIERQIRAWNSMMEGDAKITRGKSHG